jgi:hypothetical protein
MTSLLDEYGIRYNYGQRLLVALEGAEGGSFSEYGSWPATASAYQAHAEMLADVHGRLITEYPVLADNIAALQNDLEFAYSKATAAQGAIEPEVATEPSLRGGLYGQAYDWLYGKQPDAEAPRKPSTGESAVEKGTAVLLIVAGFLFFVYLARR